jgi:tetratricopeptide (TPR) repeat protein
MRKITYLILALITLVALALFFRQYFSAKTPSQEVYVEEENHEGTAISNYLAGTVAQKKGNIEKSVELFEKALIQDPKNTEIVKRLYGLYLFMGNYEKAIEMATRQTEIDKERKTKTADLDHIAYLLVSLNKLLENKSSEIPALLEPITDPKIEAETHLDGVVIPMLLSWSYVINADYTSSFRVIDNITSQYMLSVFSYNRALINDLANNKPVKFEDKNLSTPVLAQKMMSEIFFELGQFSIQNSNLDEAVVYLRLARYLDKDSNKLKGMLALTFEAMGRNSEALKTYYEISQTSENYGDVLLKIALIQSRMGENEKAIETLEKLKGLEGYKYKAIFGIGSVKLSEDKYHDAIKYFEKAKKEIEKPQPENWNLYFSLGVAYDKIGDWKNAEANLKESIKLFPQNPESLNYLAYSWLIKGKNIQQARAMLETAVIKSGGAPHILDSYGWALYKLGNYKEAIPFLEQAANGMPSSAVIIDHLGDAYWKAGRKREAKFQWQKALDAYDNDKDISKEISKEDLKKKIENGL